MKTTICERKLPWAGRFVFILAGALHQPTLGVGAPPVGLPALPSAPLISATARAGSIDYAGTAAGVEASQAVAVASPGSPEAEMSSSESIGMRQERVQAALDAEIRTGTSGEALGAIEKSWFDTRGNLAAGIIARLSGDEKEFAKLKLHVSADEAGANFTTAMTDVAARENTLKARLAAVSTTMPGEWTAARADLAADYGAYAEAATRARVLAAAGPSDASAMLDAGTTIDAVHSADFRAHGRIAEAVKAKLIASATAVATLKRRGASLQGNARADFELAAADMAAGQRRLRTSVRAAERAHAGAWNTARAHLAADYGFYAEAVARAEFAASARGSIASDGALRSNSAAYADSRRY